MQLILSRQRESDKRYDVDTATPALTAVTLTASATGGANVYYQFLANGTMIRDYATDATCTWTPTAAGTYSLTVVAKDVNVTSPVEVASTALSYQVTTALSLATSSGSTGPANTGVTITADAVGLSDPQYRFRVGSKDHWGRWQWSDLCDYSAGNSVTWTPEAAGTYTLTVWARESSSAATYDLVKNLVFTVTE